MLKARTGTAAIAERACTHDHACAPSVVRHAQHGRATRLERPCAHSMGVQDAGRPELTARARGAAADGIGAGGFVADASVRWAGRAREALVCGDARGRRALGASVQLSVAFVREALPILDAVRFRQD